jgi:hypothetical protein
MRRQPVEFMAWAIEFASREIVHCPCGGLLSFDTDGAGYVIESCSRCHSRGGLKQARRSVAELPPLKPSRIVIGDPCIEKDCGAPTIWRGLGLKPKRCPECTDSRQREQSRVWGQKNRTAKGRAA